MKQSFLSIHIKDQLKDFISQTPKGVLAYQTMNPLRHDMDSAKMDVRISDTGGIYVTVIFKKPNWGYMAIHQSFNRRPGFGERALINLSVEIHNYIQNKMLTLFHTEILYEYIESLPKEYVYDIEELAFAKGYETCYEKMTVEDVDKVKQLMKDNPQKELKEA